MDFIGKHTHTHTFSRILKGSEVSCHFGKIRMHPPTTNLEPININWSSLPLIGLYLRWNLSGRYIQQPLQSAGLTISNKQPFLDFCANCVNNFTFPKYAGMCYFFNLSQTTPVTKPVRKFRIAGLIESQFPAYRLPKTVLSFGRSLVFLYGLPE